MLNLDNARASLSAWASPLSVSGGSRSPQKTPSALWAVSPWRTRWRTSMARMLSRFGSPHEPRQRDEVFRRQGRPQLRGGARPRPFQASRQVSGGIGGGGGAAPEKTRPPFGGFHEGGAREGEGGHPRRPALEFAGQRPGRRPHPPPPP